MRAKHGELGGTPAPAACYQITGGTPQHARLSLATSAMLGVAIQYCISDNT